MRYICPICKTKFDEPFKSDRNERVNGFMARFVELSCPICGSPYFDELDTCPKCDGDKIKREILCKDCRTSLLEGFNDYADRLTEEEEDQLDDWLDGDTIKNRKKWR